MSSKDSSDLQSWNEVPSIAHFCSLFRQAFDLLEFDIQELEESLLLMGTEDDTTKLVLRLLIKLLRGCSKSFTSNISEDNYNTYLRRLFLSKREEAEEEKIEFNFDCTSLVDEDIDFPDLPLRERVLILQQLCEFRLDAEDVFDKLRNLEASSLRVDPLGTDSENVTYWYFYGTRLYKELPPSKDHKSKKHNKEKEKDKKKKKKEKKKKKDKKKKRGDSISSAEDEPEVEPEPQPTWSVACLTLKDWEDLTAKYKKSKKKIDRDLYETLHDNFLPEIVKMFVEKEKEERRRLLMMQPKRASGRLEFKRREQEEKEKEIAMKMEEQRRVEEEYDEKLRLEREARDREEREIARQERHRQRELMKELRAKRATEREVAQAMEDLKRQQEESKQKAKAKRRSDEGEEDNEDDGDDLFEPPPAVAARVSHSYDDDDDDDDQDEDDEVGDDEGVDDEDRMLKRNGKRNKSSTRNNKTTSGHRSTFTNALLRAGTKSTKDVSLDKPVRKMPGLLLETAGRSLLQKRTSGDDAGGHSAASNASSRLSSSGGLSFGLLSSKISFGLYDGHLPVDHSSYTKSSDDTESDSDIRSPKIRPEVRPPLNPPSSSGDVATSPIMSVGSEATKKVFSNWGGEFFKRNLDYRANTNKILEKMNLNVGTGGGAGHTAASAVSGVHAKSANGESTIGDRFKSSLGSPPNAAGKLALVSPPSAVAGGVIKRPLESISSTESSPVKKFKAFNSYA